jgi:hypothetical protein
MATFNQTFLLLIEKDPFFKKECDFITEKWKLEERKSGDKFFNFKQISDLPIDYIDDLEFILYQSKLPRRYLWVLHKYIVAGTIPKQKDLPKSTRFFYHFPKNSIEYMSIEIDADASQKDIRSVLSTVTNNKKTIQKIYNLDKKSQPILNMNLAKKIIGSNATGIGDIADEMHDSNIQSFRDAKNKLDVKQHRYRKKFLKGKISISKKDEYEKYIEEMDSGF